MIALAPLISGIITKIKNLLRFRKGPSIFQPYYDLIKYFGKDEVISEDSSWIFRATPYIVLSSTITALMLVPSLAVFGQTGFIGDFLTVIFLLALGRFFLALAGLDPATTFGGMGSSREMFISSLVEPVAMLAVMAVSLQAGTTDLSVMAQSQVITASTIIAFVSLFLVMLAETSRLPIDNQETHLELTMVHEAMVLEYSGRSLALLELASYLKQMIFFLILALLILPGFGSGWAAGLVLLAKLLALAVTVAVVEVSLAKMRLFRVVDFLSFAGVLSVMAVIALVLGI